MRLHDGKTLRNSGWLRESPRNLVPYEWLAIKSRSALRKCMFLPAPRGPGIDDAVRDVPAPQARQRLKEDYSARAPRRIDPMRHAQILPAQAEPLTPRRAWAHRSDQLVIPMNESLLSSPIVIGILLAFAPPVGLAAVWMHPRYDRDARWALTATSALFMVMATVALVMFAR